MLSNLKAEMARHNIKVETIAVAINRTKRAVRSRVEGRVPMSAKDIKAIRDTFFPECTLDYLLVESAPADPVQNDQTA